MFDLNVVFTAYAFRACTTLRFNFRSGMDCGITAAEDLRAACDFMLSLDDAPPERLVLLGYSYGSLVVADVAPQLDAVVAFGLLMPPLGVRALLFGLPFRRDPAERARASTKPKLAVIGTHDQFCSPRRFDAWAQSLNEPAEVCVLQGPQYHESCCGGAHQHVRQRPVDHFNGFELLEPQGFRPWVKAVFGCQLEDLDKCDGHVV